MTTQIVSARRFQRLFPVLRRPFSEFNRDAFYAELNYTLEKEGSHFHQKEHNTTYKVPLHYLPQKSSDDKDSSGKGRAILTCHSRARAPSMPHFICPTNTFASQFVDRAQIEVHGGRGGNGCVSFEGTSQTCPDM